MTFLQSNRNSLLGLLGASVLPLLCSSTALWLAYTYQTALTALPNLAWAGLYALLAVAMGLALIPTTLASVLGGYFLGFWALLPTVPAYLMAVGISFYLARRLDGQRFLQSLESHKGAQQVANRLRQSPLQAVIYTKLSPILPFAMSNFLLALLQVPLRTFLLGSLVGMLPRTSLAIIAGMGMQHLQDDVAYPLWGKLLLGGLLLGTAWGLYRLVGR